MSFNLWHGGEAGGQPFSSTVAAVRKSGADIVGLQETEGLSGQRPDNGRRLAEALGWNHVAQSGRRAVISRFPLAGATAKGWGVAVAYAPDRHLMVFNVHFAHAPYQPYQLLQIPYESAPFITTADEAIAWAERSRGRQVASLLEELAPVLRSGGHAVLTGDFNEPSHLDWTEASRLAGRCPLAVAFPTTRRIHSAGMRDTWRVVHPDEVMHPGITWTPTTSPDDPADHHDRIDFVFVSDGLECVDCQVVGEGGPAEITLNPWPSDHRAVVATVRVP